MPARYVTNLLDKLNHDRVALVGEDLSMTGSEVLTESYRIARALDRLDLRPGDGLACVAGNDPRVVPVRLAAHVLGLRYTAIQSGAHAIDHIIADARVSLVIRDLDEFYKAVAGEDGGPMDVRAEDHHIAKLTYTSGTTGLPKGVPATFGALHAAAAANSSGASSAVPVEPRFLAVTPFAHVSGDISMIMLSLGVAVEVFDFEPGKVLRTIEGLRGTAVLTYLYPALIYQLLDYPEPVDTSALSFVIYGSAPITPDRLRQAMARFGPIFQQGYASTEAPSITGLTVPDHLAGLGDRPELLSSAGRALPGVEIRIVDGEVCVRSASLMPGYWRRPDLTAEVLRDGWFHTGDLGRIDDDGYLYLLGRVQETIIVGGYNCYALPIEAVLSEHPAVRQAAVIGVPDDTTGSAIRAYVVTDGPVDAADLRTLVTDRLGAVNAPTSFRFVDHIPLTSLGKPNKKAL